LPEITYLTPEQLVEINRKVLQEIKVKRADSHRVANRRKLDALVGEVRDLDGGLYEKASCLIMGLVGLKKGHAFDSGNRRTAYVAAKLFLEANGKGMGDDFEASVLTGIREGFYAAEEVVEWLKGNGIREFRRYPR